MRGTWTWQAIHSFQGVEIDRLGYDARHVSSYLGMFGST